MNQPRLSNFICIFGAELKQKNTMEEPIKQIGERLKGLREVLDIPAEEIAQLCDISLEGLY